MGVVVAMGFTDEAMVIIELLGLGGCMGMSGFMGPREGAACIVPWVDMGLIEWDMDFDIDMCMFRDIEGVMDGVAEGVLYAAIG